MLHDFENCSGTGVRKRPRVDYRGDVHALTRSRVIQTVGLGETGLEPLVTFTLLQACNGVLYGTAQSLGSNNGIG